MSLDVSYSGNDAQEEIEEQQCPYLLAQLEGLPEEQSTLSRSTSAESLHSSTNALQGLISQFLQKSEEHPSICAGATLEAAMPIVKSDEEVDEVFDVDAVPSSKVEVPKRAFRTLDQLKGSFKQKLAQPSDSTAAVENCTKPVETHQKTMRVGTLTKIFQGKGFGFIAPDDGDVDVFLHFSNMKNGAFSELVEGTRVQFESESDPKTGKKRAKIAELVEGGVAKDGEAIQSSDRAQRGAAQGKPANIRRIYPRELLLQALEFGRRSRNGLGPDRLGITSLYLPEGAPSTSQAWKRQSWKAYEQDPNLDDEKRVAMLEARLSRESGMDKHNKDTFGESAGGWTFEEALEANEKISSEFGHSTTASVGGSSSEHGDSCGYSDVDAREWEEEFEHDVWLCPSACQ